ncbi:ARS binding protein 2-domain-containing protein [Bombardia bombarda]|uniref:ARS binding protein 2-domain-containing protein n=1 Tax=Bombardia bombarda TaxID=252184 RepID=A0AA39TML1_9PEZI|nr:ARS binding protein 2-domain-containing protein [Bombardia bombarda]
MQRPPQHQSVFTASPNSVDPGPDPASRRLPDRNVNNDTIEDTYVAFVLYCNPAVPPDTDSANLREAFRTPPKSGGKTFSTYVLFELIKQLDAKELKTWAELALKLGVEPPDQEKGQSSQKIQQYAVRLKRWMHSMHVDAFFEFLLDRPQPYWTEIPSDQTPITESGRDGVAAEDDMALRALLPQIKPRRGRRKPDDDEAKDSPSQRPSPLTDEYGNVRNDGGLMEPWSAQPPDGRGSVFLFPSDPSRLSAIGQTSVPSWASNDVAQTPMSAYPHSAITPSTRNAFWADEPRSAITPSKPRSMSRRHGAKVVSSAWRSSIGSGTGKTRGRPPINRGINSDGPYSAFPGTSEMHTFKLPSPIPESDAAMSHDSATPSQNIPPPSFSPTVPPAASITSQPVVQSPIQASPAQESAPRPAKRSRLSLQVPERVGGEVRLATPPPPLPSTTPVVMINGQSPRDDAPTPASASQQIFETETETTPSFLPQPQSQSQSQSLPQPQPPPPPSQQQKQKKQAAVSFTDPTDRTNLDALEAFFVSEILIASWCDADNKSIPPCTVDEAWGICETVIENLLGTAVTKEAFLINLAALAGGRLLMNTNCLKIKRLEEMGDRTRYSCSWELRLGDIRGEYSMEEVVLVGKWRGRDRGRELKRKRGGDGENGGGNGNENGNGEGGGGGEGKDGDREEGIGHRRNGHNNDGNGGRGVEDDENASEGINTDNGDSYWQKRYKEMAVMLQKKDDELAQLKAGLVGLLRGPNRREE